MIVREIKNADEKFFDTFDYWNDFDDTLAWAKRNAPDKVEELVLRNHLWWKEHNKKMLCS